jgi:ADP-ribose pyrophosphatase YjhB (NUDIX family)
MPGLDATIHGIYFKGRTVLLARSRAGWTFPGGHIEHGQSASKALRMERREELGKKWKVDGERLCAVYVKLGRRGLPTRIMFYVRGSYRSGTPVAQGEIKEVEWVSLSAAKRRLANRDSPRWVHALEDSQADVPVFRFLD